MLTDGAGKTKTGYLGAAGAGETTSDILPNGDMELWDDANTPTGWTPSVAGTSTVNQESSIKYGGLYSCRYDVDASSSRARISRAGTFVDGALYRLRFRIKAPDTSHYVRWYLYSSTTAHLKSDGKWYSGTGTNSYAPTTTDWEQYELYFQGSSYASATFYIDEGYYTNCSLYIDDISLVRITDPDSTGLHVYDGYNSTDRGWAATDAGFDPITIASYKIYSNLTADFYNADSVSVFTVDESGNLDSDGVYKVDGTQVVGPRVIDARASAVANSGDATTDGLIDALRDAMISHGLIAAS